MLNITYFNEAYSGSKHQSAIRKKLIFIFKICCFYQICHTLNYFSTVSAIIKTFIIMGHQFLYPLLVERGCL